MKYAFPVFSLRRYLVSSIKNSQGKRGSSPFSDINELNKYKKTQTTGKSFSFLFRFDNICKCFSSATLPPLSTKEKQVTGGVEFNLQTIPIYHEF